MVRPEETPQSDVKPQGTAQPVMRLQGTPQSVSIPHESPECEEPEPFQIDDSYREGGTPNYKKSLSLHPKSYVKNIP